MPAAKALFCYELSSLVADVSVPAPIAEWINDNILLDFQTIYLLEKDEQVTVAHPDIAITKGFSFDASDEGEILALFSCPDPVIIIITLTFSFVFLISAIPPPSKSSPPQLSHSQTTR